MRDGWMQRAILVVGWALLLPQLAALAGCSTVRIYPLEEACARHKYLRQESGQKIAGFSLAGEPYVPYNGTVRAVGADSLEFRLPAIPFSWGHDEFAAQPADEGERVLRVARSEVESLGVVELHLRAVTLMALALAFPTAYLTATQFRSSSP